jgi:hypothetical protein
VADQPLDPPRIAPSAALAQAMAADGVDLTDEAAVTAWLDEFDDRPFAERMRVFVEWLPPLPPLSLPDDETLAAMARSSRAMDQMTTFLDWIGGGRRLTPEGNLELSDGYELTALLDVGDPHEPVIAGRAFNPPSVGLDDVDLVFRLSLASGFARRDGHVLRRTDTTGDAIRSPAVLLDRWRALVRAMLDMGVVRAGRGLDATHEWWQEHVDESALSLLAAFGIARRPASLDDLTQATYDRVVAVPRAGPLPEREQWQLTASVADGVDRMVDRCCWLGLFDRGVVTDPEWGGGRRRASVSLTALGLWFVRPLLIAQGYKVPPPGAFATESAGALLDVIGAWPEDAFAAEVRVWAGRRADPADELAAAAVHAQRSDRRAHAFAALGVLGDRAERAVRALAVSPALRPHAVCWLVAHGFEPPESLTPLQATPDAIVETLAIALAAGGPAAVHRTPTASTADPGNLAVIARLWRVDHPHTAGVLDALGSSPVRQVAHVARRALLKLRNLG